MGNLTKIQTITVPSGGQPNIQFTNIPNTYVDLFLVLTSRTNRSNSGHDNIKIYFNDDTTAGNYNALRYYNATTTLALESLSGWDNGLLPTSGDTATANHFGSAFFYIQNYANTSYAKSMSFRGGGADNSSTAARSGGGDLCWTGTAAINKITIAPVTGTSFKEFSSAILYGISGQSVGGSGSKATGGTVTTSGGYTYHTFRESGNFIPSTNISGAEVLVIAGGGGAGANSWATGGGGAGGLVYSSGQSLNSGTKYPVIVGAGGQTGYATEHGKNGHDSMFGTLTIAKGGGGGGGYQGGGANDFIAQVGGSGGGGASGQNYGGTGTGAAGTAGQGNAGGNSYYNPNMTGGGGGGAGAAGGNATTTVAGSGGNGVNTYSAWGAATGTGHNISGTYWYAGGGGGSSGGLAFSSTTGGQGGNGGGGAGAGWYEGFGSDGMPNTGGGAGAMGRTGQGGGGSGIVIVRYTT